MQDNYLSNLDTKLASKEKQCKCLKPFMFLFFYSKCTIQWAKGEEVKIPTSLPTKTGNNKCQKRKQTNFFRLSLLIEPKSQTGPKLSNLECKSPLFPENLLFRQTNNTNIRESI